MLTETCSAEANTPIHCTKEISLGATVFRSRVTKWLWAARQRCNYPGRGHLLPEGNISDHLEIMVMMLCRHRSVRDFKQAPELKARGGACRHIFLDKMWVPTLRTGSSTTVVNSISEEFSHQLFPRMSLHQAKAISHVTGWH